MTIPGDHKMKSLISVVSAAFMLALSVPAGAHHNAISFFHQDQTVEVKGVVKSWRFTNPHPALRIEVTDEKGQVVLYEVSFGNTAATALAKRGWSIDTFKVGETVIAKGHPSKAPGSHGIDGSVTRADGSPVVAGDNAGRGAAGGGAGGGRGEGRGGQQP
jgi:hypothetical protein